MKMIRFALVVATLGFGLNAFAYNDNDPNNDWRSCSPGFSRDVFGTCEPDYTFPGGRGHDDDGTPKYDDNGFNGSSNLHVCYSSDRHGHTYKVSGRNLARVQQRALNACVNMSARPRSCRLSACN